MRIIDVIEETSPTGPHKYKYLKIYEASQGVQNSKSTLKYIENNDKDNVTNLNLARKYYLESIDEYVSLIHEYVHDTTLKLKWLSAIEN